MNKIDKVNATIELDGNTQDFEAPVSSAGLGQGVGNLCEAGYMEPYWLGKK